MKVGGSSLQLHVYTLRAAKKVMSNTQADPLYPFYQHKDTRDDGEGMHADKKEEKTFAFVVISAQSVHSLNH